MESITFLTRHYPPSLNINGESVCDMVAYIREHYNVECNIVHIDKELGEGGKKREPIGNVIKVKNYLDYNIPLFKGLKMLLDGFLLVQKAKKIKNTLYVITTSPPLLPFWSSWLLGSKRKRAFWALDLFPEAFSAKGAISSSNLIYKWVIKKTYSVLPEFIIALGPKQARYLAGSCFKNDAIKTLLLPCGFFEDKAPEKAPVWYDKDKIMMGYCGSIHDAHNPDFVINMIDAIDPTKQQLILALYGDKSSAVIEYAKNKKGVYLTKSVPRNELTFIDIHLVSLLPNFTHYAVPSKAVSAITMGKTILFSGSKESDSWELFMDVGWFVEDGKLMTSELITFCKSITKYEVEQKQKQTEVVSEKLRAMVNETYDFVGQFIANKND
jgi:hypothetical protein